MKYPNKEVQDVFRRNENFDGPLELLEQSFKAAGLDIEFVCDVGADKAKIVSVYRGGFLKKQISIEGDSPAMAVKDVAERVKL